MRFFLPVFFFILIVPSVFAKSVTLTTYYPAPAGEYDNINATNGSFTTLTATTFNPSNIAIGTVTTDNQIALGTAGPAIGITSHNNTDAGMRFNIGAQFYSLGIDQSDSLVTPKFKLDHSASLGLNNDIVLDTTGNVGIGSASPTQKLDINGRIAVNGTQMIYLPNQTNFYQSLAIGNGGVGLSHAGAADGYRNTSLGINSGLFITTGYQNTSVGSESLRTNTTGTSNTAVGAMSLMYASISGNNTAIGMQALGYTTTGGSNTAAGTMSLVLNTSGDYNTAVGEGALYSNQAGANNSAIGYHAGYGPGTATSYSNNIFIGHKAGDAVTGGSDNNIVMGYDIDLPAAGDNQLTIGNLIFGTGINGTGTTLSTGNIGIGIAVPTAKLEVSGGAIKATGGLIVETRTSDPASPATGQIWLRTDI